MKSANIIEQLKRQGSRITKARGYLIDIFQNNHLPLTELELRTLLSKLGAVVNKTTVYRELAYLREKNIIKAVDFGDGKKRYEINSTDHHHIVCTNCGRLEDFSGCDFVALEKKALKQNKSFKKITHHSLELFGLCQPCSN